MNFNRLNKKQLLLLLVFSLVLAQVVNAENVFEQAFQSFGTLSPDFYDKHWWWLDLIAYAFLFIGIGQFALKGKMGDEKGKLGIIVGAILAASLIVYELKTGFRLANLMPLALFLLAFVVGALVYHFATGMGASKVFAFSFAYLSTYAIIVIHAGEIIASLESIKGSNGAAGLLLGALRIGLIVAAIGLIYSVIKGVGSLFSGGFFGERGDLESGLGAAGRAAGNLPGINRVRANVNKSEEDATQMINIENYEKKLDQFARMLGKGEIRDVQQFEGELQDAIKLAEEIAATETELEQLAREVQAGQAGYTDATKNKIQDLRNRYGGLIKKLFGRVEAAHAFAMRERQEFIAELNDIIKAAQADSRVNAFISSLARMLGADKKAVSQFLKDNNFKGKVAADINMLFSEMQTFNQLEESKKKVLAPQVPFLRQLIQETNGEIRELDYILANMRALDKSGGLRRPQLEQLKVILGKLLGMAQRKQHAIQQSEDILAKVRATDQKLAQIMTIYKRLLSTEFQQLKGGVKKTASTQLSKMNLLRI
ncbi:hypothetical protein HYY73_01865 [Candidatus Woesearchaeota archaeon]|nr:hypothetical protein [Candidatus Woesearchaeota archaeon]